jgi:hypothetical protein
MRNVSRALQVHGKTGQQTRSARLALREPKAAVRAEARRKLWYFDDVERARSWNHCPASRRALLKMTASRQFLKIDIAEHRGACFFYPA